MADNAGPAAIALGIVATGVGIVAVNHMVSKPGESWYDRIRAKLASKGEEPSALPEKAARSRTVPPAFPTSGPRGSRRPVQPQAPGYYQLPRRPFIPPYRTPSAAAPLAVTPEMVRQIAEQLNAVFGTNLRTDGIINPDVQQVIKQVQAELGLPQTGFPDARLLSALGAAHKAHHRKMAKPATSSLSEATNVISKTFGGPASTPSTGPDEGVKKAQALLNAYFKDHILDENGIMSPKTIGAIIEFQKALGLPTTGKVDDKTYDMLVRLTSEGGSLFEGSGSWLPLRPTHLTGAPVGGAGGDWKSETEKLGHAAQDVIDKAISESDPKTLTGLSRALKAAGFAQAAAATAPKTGAGTTATTGGPGYFPDPFFGWYGSWADPYTFGRW